MNSKLAKRLFRESDQLYRGKNFAAALDGLDRLDKAFPDTHRILYPRAMCLAEVGRIEEAIAICDRLISRHKYKRAVELKTRIQTYQRALPTWNAGVPAVAPSNIERLPIEFRPSSAFAPVPPQLLPMWRTTSARVIVGVVTFVLIVAVGAYFAASRDADVVNAAPPAAVASPAEPPIAGATPEEGTLDSATAEGPVVESASLQTISGSTPGAAPN